MISLRKLAKQEAIPKKFLLHLHNTGRLSFKGFPKKIEQSKWEHYKKEVGNFDKKKGLLWHQFKKWELFYSHFFRIEKTNKLERKILWIKKLIWIKFKNF